MQLPFVLPAVLNLALNHTRIESTLSSDPTCPFIGQVYPAPSHIGSSSIWQEAVKNLNDALADVPGLQDDSSYAIKIMSLHDSTPLYEHYHRAPAHEYGETGSAQLDGQAIFRIASVSKVFTVYALLLECGFKCFNDPITKYVPELLNYGSGDAVSEVDWDEVTLGALASQISGLGRDFSLAELALNPAFQPGTQFGFPDVNSLDPGALPQCGAGPAFRPCSREESIEGVAKHAPVFPPYYGPAYSNIAYQLLGFAIENITGQSYEEVIYRSITKPLELSRTTTRKPESRADAVTIPGDPFFSWSLNDEIPTGGIYTSTDDLTNLGLAFLNNTQLSPSNTRRWLKPQSHTSNPQFSFGAPWEIYHIPGLSTFHTIDQYTKGGNLVTYTTQFAVLPDLDIAIAVNTLTLNPFINAQIIYNIQTYHTLKALYDVAKQQAAVRFSGTYTHSQDGHSSKLTVTTDDDIGLTVTEWINNGKDFYRVLEAFGFPNHTIRLFPTTLASMSKHGGKRTAFRAELLGTGMQCVSWGLVDAIRWAGVSLDLLVFEIDEDSGMVGAVELPAWRATYQKVKGRKLQTQV